MKTVIIKTLIILFGIFTITNFAQAKPVFSKVYFFGDSLTDVGNNHDKLLDQAPITNKELDNSGKYVNGAVWVEPFLEFMRKDG